MKHLSVKVPAFAVLLALCCLGITAAAEELPQELLKPKIMGDKAYEDGAYEQALIFYLEYKNAAASRPEVLKDALLCLVPACIKVGKAEDASKYLAELCEKYPGLAPEQKALFKGEIALASGKPEDAAAHFGEALQELAATSEFFPQLLSRHAYAEMQAQNWDAAEQDLIRLKDSCKGTKWEAQAYLQKIYVLIMKKQFADAREELLSYPQFSSPPDTQTLRLLNLLLLANDAKGVELAAAYAAVRKGTKEEAQPLLYTVAMSVARLLMEKKDYKGSLPFLKDSFIFAASSEDRKEALRQMVSAYTLAGLKEEAATAAKKYLEYYGDSPDSENMKIQSARLFHDAGRTDEALSLFASLMDDANISMQLRFQSARESARILADRNDFSGAERKLSFILAKAQDENARGEAKYLFAELLMLHGKYREAVEAFLKVASNYKDWREKSLSQAMHACIELGENAKALELSESLIKEYPATESNKEALYFHAALQGKLGKRKEALSEFLAFAKNYPTHPRAPDALFGAGSAAFDEQNYLDAEKIFSEFIASYPSGRKAPNALYKRLYSRFLRGDNDAATKDALLLAEKYPGSRFAAASLFWLADCQRNAKNYAKAKEILNEIRARHNNDTENAARALYELALLCRDTERDKEAEELLKELFSKYPASSVLGDGFFLNGDIMSEWGEYAKAVVSYQKSATLRPNSRLELNSRGRIGDCQFALYSETYEQAYLKSAAAEYEKVLARKEISGMTRQQLLYKLGRCHELLAEEEKALSKYREVLYTYRAENELESKKTDPAWLVKAAQAGISMCLKRNTPESLDNATEFFRALRDLQVLPAVDYEKQIRDLKEKQKSL